MARQKSKMKDYKRECLLEVQVIRSKYPQKPATMLPFAAAVITALVVVGQAAVLDQSERNVRAKRQMPSGGLIEGDGRQSGRSTYKKTYNEKVISLRANSSLVNALPTFPVDQQLSARPTDWFSIAASSLSVKSIVSSPSGRWLYCLKAIAPSITNYLILKDKVVLKVNSSTGSIAESWGGSTFLNPGRLAVDIMQQIWVTDNSLYQVVMLNPGGNVPTLRLGSAEVPYRNSSAFCLPCDVAAVSDGTIIVADGVLYSYHNNMAKTNCQRSTGMAAVPARLMKFTNNGVYIGEFDLAFSGNVRISLDERQNRIFVADVLRGSIYVYGAGLNGAPNFGNHLGDTAIAHTYIQHLQAHPSLDLLYVGTESTKASWGFGLSIDTTDLASMTVTSKWSPPGQDHGFYYMEGLSMASSGSVLYAADNNDIETRVWKFSNSAN